jgi:hypothetical protein
VRYLSLVVSSFQTGLYPALQAAGLTNSVAVSDTAPTQTDVVNIENGQIQDSVVIETEIDGYRFVDLAARYLTHTPLPYIHVPSAVMVITKANVKMVARKGIANFPWDKHIFLSAWRGK